MRLIFLVPLVLLTLSSCSSKPTSEDKKPENLALGTPTPSPTPPKPEDKWRCKISNTEGRVFVAIDDTADVAESKGRAECGRTYRHCILLSCDLIEGEEASSP